MYLFLWAFFSLILLPFPPSSVFFLNFLNFDLIFYLNLLNLGDRREFLNQKAVPAVCNQAYSIKNPKGTLE